MKFTLAFLMLLALAAQSLAATKIKVDSVPAKYQPSCGAETAEPVSMAGFHFEVNRETNRARVVVDYTYPDAPVCAAEGRLGPQPTHVQLPGLTYNREEHEVVYSAEGKDTVCAVLHRRSFFGPSVRNTGSCVVKATVTAHAEDDGWSIHRFHTIDTYFEVPEPGGEQSASLQNKLPQR
jgi:hypothetical protein